MVFRALMGNVGLVCMTVGVAMVPLVTVQIILMTTPFWAAIVSVLFTSDTVKRNEIIIMVLSFICVVTISVNDASKAKDEEVVVEEDESTFLADWSASAVYVVGALVMLSTAMINSVITVQSRMLQGYHFIVLQFWVAAFSVLFTGAILVIENLSTGGPFRAFQYDGTQYLWIAGIAVSQILCMMAKIITFQNERPAFVSIMTYVSIVYAFAGDIVVFDKVPYPLTVIGCVIILTLNITLYARKFREQSTMVEKDTK